MADGGTKRFSCVKNFVCRTCNGNIILKNFPLDLFGVKATGEGIVRDLEKFCGLKVTIDDGLPSRLCKNCYVKIVKIQEFVKMIFESKAPQESVIRAKRGKSAGDSPSSASSPGSKREKKKSKVRTYVLRIEGWSNYRIHGHFGPPNLHVLEAFVERSI